MSALLARGATVIFRPHPFSYDFADDATTIARIKSLLEADARRTGQAASVGSCCGAGPRHLRLHQRLRRDGLRRLERGVGLPVLAEAVRHDRRAVGAGCVCRRVSGGPGLLRSPRRSGRSGRPAGQDARRGPAGAGAGPDPGRLSRRLPGRGLRIGVRRRGAARDRQVAWRTWREDREDRGRQRRRREARGRGPPEEEATADALRAELVALRAAGGTGRSRPRRNGVRAARPSGGTSRRADLADHWPGAVSACGRRFSRCPALLFGPTDGLGCSPKAMRLVLS